MPKTKNVSAVALGRLGGLKGGPARMAAMSKEERSALGRAAARARWEGATARSAAAMESLASSVREEAARVGPLVPTVTLHDLFLILGRRLRPWGSGQKFFIRRSPEGHYVF